MKFFSLYQKKYIFSLLILLIISFGSIYFSLKLGTNPQFYNNDDKKVLDEGLKEYQSYIKIPSNIFTL
ncbi:MAG: hypothetical protein ACFFEY_13340 [Candidatus Thorarchaeota archaeon]